MQIQLIQRSTCVDLINQNIYNGSAFIDHMPTKNVTLKIDSQLYSAYRSYCKKKGLIVSQQFEMMIRESVGPNYKRIISTDKINSNHGLKAYVGSLTGEPFMLHENKIVASLLLNSDSIDLVKQITVQENLFGYRTVKSISKRVNSIIKRISKLDPLLLSKIATDLSGDGRVVVLYSIYLRDRLFRELLNEVITEKFSTRDFNFDRRMIQNFISDKSDSETKIQEFTIGTKLKLANVMFNILKESGLIGSDNNSFKLNSVLISSDLRNYYINKDEIKFLKCIGVSI